MKKDLHPQYNPVVFVDMTTGKRFISRSTKTTDKKEVIDGVEHSVISIGITSDSHPFFTGLAQFVDTEGRIDINHKIVMPFIRAPLIILAIRFQIKNSSS